MDENKDEIVRIVKNWIEKLIIGMNLCPFAKDPYNKNAIRINISYAASLAEGMNFFQREIRYFAKHSKIETSLLVLPAFSDIKYFQEVVMECEKWLFFRELYRDYQMTFFHPNARIPDFPIDSPHQLVIQAPYPILHLLRVASVERLGAKMKEDVQIVNDKKLSQMTVEHAKKLWQEIYDKPNP